MNCIYIQIVQNFIPNDPIGNKLSIASDNGLPPNRPQPIIWTNDGLLNWHINGSLGLGEFTLDGSL